MPGFPDRRSWPAQSPGGNWRHGKRDPQWNGELPSRQGWLFLCVVVSAVPMGR